MATDIMSGISLDGYSFYYEWHEFRKIRLLLWVALGYMITITATGGARLNGYSY